MAILPPLKAINKFCRQCMGGDEVDDCSAGSDYLSVKACPLFPYRNGTEPKTRRKRETMDAGDRSHGAT